MMAKHCWLGSSVVFQGIQTSIIAKKPYSFVIFQGGGGADTGCQHPLRIRECDLGPTACNIGYQSTSPKMTRKRVNLTLKAPIMTAADDKFYDIFPNFQKNIRHDIT